MPFEIIHKPTFTNQLLAIPKERVIQVLEKIEVLRDDPKPHGKLKKKLHGYKGDIYRLRSGDFRIIYTYGDGWVALLGVDARKDIYKGDKLIAEETEIDVAAFANLEDLLTPNRPHPPTPSPKIGEGEPENLLPVGLTEELLDRPSEGDLLAQFCRTAAREFRLGIGACAILTPTEKSGKNIAGQLSYLGVEATFMTSRELNLNCKGIKVLPLKAAKGLEFPIVAIAGFLDSPFSAVTKKLSDEEIAEILMRERRTLFVGMTRAMRALMVLVPAHQPDSLLQNFDPQFWNLGNA